MSPSDLDYEQCARIVDEIAEYAPLILVLSGGEPLWRRDVFDIAQRAASKNIRVALATTARWWTRPWRTGSRMPASSGLP
jgi:MoaA/NifB/PqqE/SkfB family radical SAM enzyme